MTYTPTNTASATATATETATFTPLPSDTPAPTLTTAAPPTATNSPTSTDTATYTATSTATDTPTVTLQASLTPSPTNTATASPASIGRIVTGTPFPTAPPTPRPTERPTLTQTPTPLPLIIVTLPGIRQPTRGGIAPGPATEGPGPTAIPPVVTTAATATLPRIAAAPTALVLNPSGGYDILGSNLQIPFVGIPPDTVSFDLSSTGRLAVVTRDGRLYIDGRLYDGNGKHARQRIVQARWSPDGTTLAYIAETPGAESRRIGVLEANDDGVWVTGGGEPRHILRNHYIRGSNEYPFRVARDITWAPDNDAILVSITSPGNVPASILTGRNRHANERLPGLFDILMYTDGSWLPDSSGWVTTTSIPGQGVVMGIVNRYTAAFTPVLDGAVYRLWIQNPTRLPDGRYAFLGKSSATGLLEEGPTKLQLFVYAPNTSFVAVSAPLPGSVLAAEWSPNRAALLVHLLAESGVVDSIVLNLSGGITRLPNGSTAIHWGRR